MKVMIPLGYWRLNHWFNGKLCEVNEKKSLKEWKCYEEGGKSCKSVELMEGQVPILIQCYLYLNKSQQLRSAVRPQTSNPIILCLDAGQQTITINFKMMCWIYLVHFLRSCSHRGNARTIKFKYRSVKRIITAWSY